ncbi:DUF6159 family protein [Amycolatopsis australiensis]|uniref:Membrane domain of glycerophosphoryl diester phosphodiesterase n=1 Tax=Amycolatopsis australiensis TaxID=546364 RepID=A0A1K1SU76_9PSEU|nr:DUF6159 family protein [Amycolatopsis australiensis]SFW87968.1 hypothetical protein SAMN04489730_6823 [Amycolatopsis australiensis]
MGRLARSFALFSASLKVLRAHKALAWFPVLAGISGLLVAGAFLTPAFFTAHVQAGNVQPSAGTWVLLAVCYVASAFVTIFFNAALISQADVALRGDGGIPGVGAGLAAAGRRWPALLGWAGLTATVTLLLRTIEERLGFLGSIVSSLVGLAWRLTTFLVLPVVMLEGAGVKPGVKRSVELFRRTWGENVAGSAGIGVVGFLLSLAGYAVLLLAGFLLGGTATLFACLGLAIVWTLLVAVFTTTLSGIYQTALYRYAADGVVPGEFATVDFGAVFRER